MLKYLRSKLSQWERSSIIIIDWKLRTRSSIDLECAIIKRLLRDQYPVQFDSKYDSEHDDSDVDDVDGDDRQDDDMTLRVRKDAQIYDITGFYPMCKLLAYLAYRSPSHAVHAAMLERAIALHARFMMSYRNNTYDDVYDILTELASLCENDSPLCGFESVTLADILWHETLDWLMTKTIWFDEKQCPATLIAYVQTMATYEG